MTAPSTAASAAGPPGVGPVAGRGRLLGVDAARGLALLGMMATHVLPETGADGSVTWPFLVASGRASALFALLAGVGLALSTGRREPPVGAGLSAARRGVLARAAVVTAVGLVLGLAPGRIAVILVVYGLLFAVAAVFLGLRARALAWTAAAWLVASPVAGHLLRQHLPPGPGQVPSWASLADPVRLVVDLAVTGYYPALQWTGYVLAGMAVGRSPLHRARVAAALLWVGAALAAAAAAASRALVRAVGGVPALAADLPVGSPVAPQDLPVALRTSMYGTTPTTSWGWLAVAGPHTGTPLDLLATTGSALGVLGACLLLARAGRAAAPVLVPLAAAGSMTLTLYALHVLSVPSSLAALPPGGAWVLQAVGAVVVGLAFRAARARGPLEQVAAAAASAVRRGSLSSPDASVAGAVVAGSARPPGPRAAPGEGQPPGPPP